MSIHFYNTLTRRLEEFKPIDSGEVKLYTCGPTVYNYAHIGNFRAYMFEDLLKRFLLYKGYKVKHVMNLTDVDDKIIKAVYQQNVSIDEYTKTYKDAFFKDLETLGISKAEFTPAATETIPEMVDLVKTLLDKGYAYKTDDGSVYFQISKFKDYGKLANLNIDEMQKGERVENDEYEKEELRDFALWKGYKEEDGDVYWETELGKGRPGWHIECSAMSTKYLGNHFDIHCGGVDNIFPHHENEIAQSECATGEQFVNYWLHCRHLIVNGQKMSKSLGNFYSLQDILDKGYSPEAIRLILLNTHYRQTLNFTFDKLDVAEKNITKLRNFYKSLEATTDNPPEYAELLKNTQSEFDACLSDDLNISGAIGAIFNMIKTINAKQAGKVFSGKDSDNIKSLMNEFDEVLNVGHYDEIQEDDLTDEEYELIEKRLTAKKNKNWAEADRIRDYFKDKGILLKDGPEGTTWERESI
ncbi:MAG: cysteine--tRNA ligase [Fidelibacterota bacterium]